MMRRAYFRSVREWGGRPAGIQVRRSLPGALKGLYGGSDRAGASCPNEISVDLRNWLCEGQGLEYAATVIRMTW